MGRMKAHIRQISMRLGIRVCGRMISERKIQGGKGVSRIRRIMRVVVIRVSESMKVERASEKAVRVNNQKAVSERTNGDKLEIIIPVCVLERII